MCYIDFDQAVILEIPTAVQQGFAMKPLSWLTHHRFESLGRRDYQWVFSFDDQTHLVVSCLWRLIEAGRVRITSEDEGQTFGLPTPFDAAAEVNSRLAGACLSLVDLRRRTLDLELHFADGHIIQIIADSSGYEAWQVNSHQKEFIATGGGELVIFERPPVGTIGRKEE